MPTHCIDDLQTLSHNELDEITKRVSKVSSLLKRSVELWLEISTEVFDAKRSLRQLAFEHFLNQANITKSVADKLLRIAKCIPLYSPEAQQYTKKLEGWTTLYEVAKLPDQKIANLFNAIDEDPDFVITRQSIKQFADPVTHAVRNEVIAQIFVSHADIKRLSFEQFEKLSTGLDEIARIIDRSSPAISIDIKVKALQHIESILDFGDESEFGDVPNENVTPTNPNGETYYA